MTEMTASTADPGHRKLLCDEMLARLGRWLRAAGYDTAIAEGGTPDAVLIAQARAEGRILITRDRHLASHVGAAMKLWLLHATAIEEQARELRDQYAIDWMRAPFTRCLVDNTMLIMAPAERAALVPPQSRDAGGPLRECPSCGRLYWPGGHVRRMMSRLATFHRR